MGVAQKLGGGKRGTDGVAKESAGADGVAKEVEWLVGLQTKRWGSRSYERTRAEEVENEVD